MIELVICPEEDDDKLDEMATVTGTNGLPTDETVIVVKTPTTAISSSLSSSSGQITSSITSSRPIITPFYPSNGTSVIELVICPEEDDKLDEMAVVGVLTTMTVSSVGKPLVPVTVVISVDVDVKVPVHGSVVVIMVLAVVGVLTTMMVSSVGTPLVPVIVVISVDVEVKVPVHGSVVVMVVLTV